MEQALQAALLLQERGRVQVRLLCREARVAALSLGALYDRAREAGVEIVKYAGTPAFWPAGEGAAADPVEVSLQDAVLGSPVRLAFDLLAVAPPGPAAASLPPAALLHPAGPRLQEGNVHLLPNGTCRPGVFAAGPARGEDWPPLALQEARAAALAAHALLAPGFLEVELSHPTVDAERCALCLTCVRSCPFGAMRVNAEGKAAESRPEICQRCGTCAGECPARAIELPACSGPMLETQLGTGTESR